MAHLNINYFKLKILTLLSLLILFSCSKEKNERWIEAQLTIKESGQPLKGFGVWFDVYEGDGSGGDIIWGGGTLSQAKYFARSDDQGHVSFPIFWAIQN